MDVILDVPTNLGLRPGPARAVPGVDRAPRALRAAGLERGLRNAGWGDAGAVPAGAYSREQLPGEVRNQAALLEHARRVAARVGELLDHGDRPLVLGGDCTVLVGSALGLRRRGRYGLVHVDGHTDFRHPGNSDAVGALAGEDLAAAVGIHLPAVSDLDGLAPYVDPADAVHLGCRDDDVSLDEVRSALGDVITAREWRADPDAALRRATDVVGRSGLDGYWIHVDVDVLDPQVVSAVDSPDPGGVSPGELAALLRALWPASAGAEVCIYDPGLDPAGADGRTIVGLLLDALAPVSG